MDSIVEKDSRDALYTIAEAATIVGCSQYGVKYYYRKHKFGRKVGGTVVLTHHEVETLRRIIALDPKGQRRKKVAS